jgi:AcrR family transcriptional regulator
MQKLKDEIRNRIIEAALKEFSLNGYEKASMRDISKTGGMSVSNTYNYYQNKEELFDGIIKPVYDSVKNLFRQSLMQSAQKGPAGNNTLAAIDDILREIIQMDDRQRRLFIILCENSAGTRYEKAKEDMTALLRMLLAEAVRQPGGSPQIEESRNYILNIIAENYLDGFLRVLKDYRDQAQAEEKMKTLLAYHLNGIKALTG